jgi:hypothetical protein
LRMIPALREIRVISRKPLVFRHLL